MIAPRTMALGDLLGPLRSLGGCAHCHEQFMSTHVQVAWVDSVGTLCLACAEVHQVLEYYGRDLVGLDAAMEWHLDAAKEERAAKHEDRANEYSRQAGAIARAMTAVRREQARGALS